MTASPKSALKHILETAGIDPARADEIRIEGQDPILPTRFLMGSAGAAALGAVGLAAADLWRLRGNSGQEVSIDTRRGAAALRTTHYLQVPAYSSAMFSSALSGFHQTRDGGWIQLHCEFPHFQDGVRDVLGISDDDDASAAVANWSGPELEEALAARGLPALAIELRTVHRIA